MEPTVLLIEPNTNVSLSLESSFQEAIKLIEEEQQETYSCRIIIQDENDFGITIPAQVEEQNKIIFVLPEQLCIFNPEKKYLLKAEIVFDTQLLTPFITPCKIDLKDLLGSEEEYEGQEDEEELQPPVEPLFQTKGHVIDDQIDDNIEAALDIIAPQPIVEQKKTKVDDLVKTLDQEFVKGVLFSQPQKEKAPVPVKVQEPVKLTTEQLELKTRMKSLLKGMLD